MSDSAQRSFRSQLSSFRWANSVQDDSQPPPPPTTSNPFSRAWNSMSGYIPLRNEGNSQEEEAYFALSSPLNHGSLHWPLPLEAACSCLDLPSYMVLGTVCCFLAEPPLTSDIFLVDLKHILSPERLPFSLCYFGSLGLTLFFAIGIRSTIGTLLASIIQVVALLSYVTAYFPGGMTTLRLGGQMAMRGAGNLLPI
ncbi:SFT2 domain-containing protein [Cryptococcus deuterogattii 99/473]|uniref:Protein transport protein SFT2 n=1 Tax=Cryptococcus deuterogattii Ram5 TaxID=1296110 RepID=A0A0D0V653_9TREE|nr:SFT2 domain-containing protein [Cryptococcus deuterogattii LA55]KIR35159.1 SFT2 domain-containing protein [Cryptococcus deuterogattii MMRL2647]KIR40430.1 SFT2 domain-containing protein [Cryptococcus deuterogattii Ram5]KIR72142.1 SFT2 domain-containing protein [Cryptococcus deuterogattii CA1014]KIR93703.1 SFT2 domain-containing protein [Cryptococcus deuterogattii CBS 10090]KIR99971.1 SFT2 domain-containing protein [Cryptococcus deuterogattii 2001/935-1]KIY58671.1 SFT2 domain-containing prot